MAKSIELKLRRVSVAALGSVLCHMDEGNCWQSRLGDRLGIPVAGPVLQGSKDTTGRFAVPQAAKRMRRG
jgi:hypothetical protein